MRRVRSCLFRLTSRSGGAETGVSDIEKFSQILVDLGGFRGQRGLQEGGNSPHFNFRYWRLEKPSARLRDEILNRPQRPGGEPTSPASRRGLPMHARAYARMESIPRPNLFRNARRTRSPSKGSLAAISGPACEPPSAQRAAFRADGERRRAAKAPLSERKMTTTTASRGQETGAEPGGRARWPRSLVWERGGGGSRPRSARPKPRERGVKAPGSKRDEGRSKRGVVLTRATTPLDIESLMSRCVAVWVDRTGMGHTGWWAGSY